MKKALTLIVLFSSYFCSGQDYMCLQPGVKHYFTNGNGYLRGIRIDSIVTSGSDYIFYPYRTSRKKSAASYSMDTSMGSWLGGQVIMRPDGTFLFDNFWRDTVVIRSLAGIGESWIFYDDTTNQHYTATVAGIEATSVLGVPDSIKTITIHAYASGVLNAADPLHNFQIKLSKNNGFVQVFDLYTFPYRFTEIDDYFYLGSQSAGHAPAVDFSSASLFKIVDFHNPTSIEFHNFSVGDIFEWQTTSNVMPPPYCMTCTHYLGLQSDIILAKTTLNPYHVEYIIQRDVVENNTTYPGPQGHAEINTIDTLNCDTSLLFGDLRNKMPEELTGSYYFYNPTDDFCISTPKYAIVNPPHTGGPMSKIHKNIYKLGLGRLYNEKWIYFPYGSGFEGHVSTTVYNNMIFSSTSGVVCGEYIRVPISVVDPVNVEKVLFYPNPATDQLTISSTNRITSITITNLLGQVVHNRSYDSERIEVGVADLSPGIYVVKINEAEVRKFVKQ